MLNLFFSCLRYTTIQLDFRLRMQIFFSCKSCTPFVISISSSTFYQYDRVLLQFSSNSKLNLKAFLLLKLWVQETCIRVADNDLVIWKNILGNASLRKLKIRRQFGHRLLKRDQTWNRFVILDQQIELRQFYSLKIEIACAIVGSLIVKMIVFIGRGIQFSFLNNIFQEFRVLNNHDMNYYLGERKLKKRIRQRFQKIRGKKGNKKNYLIVFFQDNIKLKQCIFEYSWPSTRINLNIRRVIHTVKEINQMLEIYSSEQSPCQQFNGLLFFSLRVQFNQREILCQCKYHMQLYAKFAVSMLHTHQFGCLLTILQLEIFISLNAAIHSMLQMFYHYQYILFIIFQSINPLQSLQNLQSLEQNKAMTSNILLLLSILLVTNNLPIRGTWFTVSGTNSPFSREGIDKVISKCKLLGLNTIYFSVWDQSMVNFEPAAHLYSKYPFLRKNPRFTFDPLQYLIETAHRVDIKVFAWFQYGFATSYNDPSGGPILINKPQWRAIDQNGKIATKNNFQWMNALKDEVQQFMIDLILSLGVSHKIDGVEGDDRLPGLPSLAGYDDQTKQRYAKQTGKYPPSDIKDEHWVQWRCDILNNFMKKLFVQFKNQYPNLGMHMAPSVFSWSKYEYLQDWPTWVNNGWVDAIFPQIYRYSISAYTDTVSQNLNFIKSEKKEIFFPGVLIGVGSNTTQNANILYNSLAVNRELGLKGQCFFYHESLNDPRVSEVIGNFYGEQKYLNY